MSSSIYDQLTTSVYHLLGRYPEGISEFELLRILGDTQDNETMSGAFNDQLSTFRAHFLLFHVLYKLRDQLWQREEGHLMIHALKIQLLPYRAAEQGLVQPDPLRVYYLDLTQLKDTSAEDVERMLSSFFQRMQVRGGREQALAELGLKDPVDNKSIKQQYRRLAMRYHPDRGGDTDRLQAINSALQRLLGNR